MGECTTEEPCEGEPYARFCESFHNNKTFRKGVRVMNSTRQARKKKRKKIISSHRLNNFVLTSTFKEEPGGDVGVICPECEGKIVIPLKVVIDFLPWW